MTTDTNAAPMSRMASIFNKAKKVLYVLFLVVIAPLYLYLNMPVINIWFMGFPLAITILASLVAIMEVRLLKKDKTWIFKIAASLGVFSLLYILVVGIASWEGFRSGSYRELIGTVKQGEHFSKDIAPISLEKIRIVDQAVADRLGDKVLGEKPAMGSQVEVGTFNIQKVNDELYWVAPLLHDGFFKWFNNRNGTPAYIMVSATNERDVRLVTEAKGQPIRICYQPSAYFGSNLHRHIYFSGYMTAGLTDFTFEIDDEGMPFWVVTLYRHDIGFKGKNAYGVLVVNATTGEIHDYTPETAPDWVDRIQPKEMVKAQLDCWGEYVNGYWNFSNQDKLTTTDGISLVYGGDNKSYWYTGLSSVGRDQATVGFVLVNTRTKETIWYPQAGATEEAAMQSAMGKVQEKGYLSSFPILYNINGVPTYVMSLKDQAGLIKMIALVSVEDYSIVGVGNNLKEATRAYKDAYNSSGKNANNFNINTSGENFTLSGKVMRVASDITGGNSYYYLYLDNVQNKVFLGSSTVSNELPLTAVGDSVQLKYEDGRTDMVDMTSFDNLSIKTSPTDKQKIE